PMIRTERLQLVQTRRQRRSKPSADRMFSDIASQSLLFISQGFKDNRRNARIEVFRRYFDLEKALEFLVISAAGRGHNSVHAQIFHDLPIMIKRMSYGKGSTIQPCNLAGAEWAGKSLNSILRRQRLGRTMSERKRVFQILHDIC